MRIETILQFQAMFALNGNIVVRSKTELISGVIFNDDYFYKSAPKTVS